MLINYTEKKCMLYISDPLSLGKLPLICKIVPLKINRTSYLWASLSHGLKSHCYLMQCLWIITELPICQMDKTETCDKNKVMLKSTANIIYFLLCGIWNEQDFSWAGNLSKSTLVCLLFDCIHYCSTAASQELEIKEKGKETNGAGRN